MNTCDWGNDGAGIHRLQTVLDESDFLIFDFHLFLLFR